MKDQPSDAGHRAAKVAVASTNTNKINSNSISASQTAIAEASSVAAAVAAASGGQSTNFADDDYNEWELGIGDLIIDLDADIEKSSDKQLANGLLSAGGSSLSPLAPSSAGTLALAATPSLGPMSSSSSGGPSAKGVARMAGTNAASPGSTSATSAAAAAAAAALVEHQATVDKGLKMKIKRKNVGSKSSEAKHEIVQSDAKSAASMAGTVNAGSNSTIAPSSSSLPATNAHVAEESAGNKSKHSSGKGRSGGHRDKKDRKDKKQSANSGDVNGVLNGTPPVTTPPSSAVKIGSVNLNALPNPTVSLTTVPLALATAVSSSTSNGITNSSATPSLTSMVSSATPTVTSVSLNGLSSTVTTSVHGNSTGPTTTQTLNSSPLVSSGTAGGGSALPSTSGGNMSDRTNSSSTFIPVVKTETAAKFSSNNTVILKTEEVSTASPPIKRVKLEKNDAVKVEKTEALEDSPSAPETMDGSTCTSIGTVTEPECLGPCEPGTSVLLEGIVWQETEGGVLVVNVTWRGKTYVGTLLDCTKHDWAPPRLCDSPVSDMDAKAGAKGRGKRGRGSGATATAQTATASSPSENSFLESRSSVQSKLRNVKGRRNAKLGPGTASTNSGFTVPSSPARGDAKRKSGRPADLELNALILEVAKGSKRSRTTAAGARASNGQGGGGGNTVDYSQPSSPTLIECPEPNCGKKYKHINGLRYHQTHAHMAPETSRSISEEASSSAVSATVACVEDGKDVATNSSDNEESQQEALLVPVVSPSAPPPLGNAVVTDSPTAMPQWPTGINSNPPTENETVDGFEMVSDLSTLASVAISDSKSSAPCSVSSPSSSSNVPSTGTQGAKQALLTSIVPVPPSSTTTTTTATPLSSESPVIQQPAISPSVTVSIPTAHVLSFSSSAGTQPPPTTSTVSSFGPSSQASVTSGPLGRSGIVTASTFVPPSSLGPSTPPSTLTFHSDKNIKKSDKNYKSAKASPALGLSTSSSSPSPSSASSTSSSSSSRPLVSMAIAPPSSPAACLLSPSSPHVLGSPLKPVQPKTNVLTEASSLSLDGLKKDKAKHKKSKNRDKDRQAGSNKTSATNPLAIVPSGDSKETDRPSMDSLNFHLSPESLAAATVANQPLSLASRPMDLPLDATTPDNSMNENVQSPAYSDISDANDTAPVLESEVSSPSDKEKLCDKSLKSPADGSLQSAVSASSANSSGNLSSYGMYSYYGQPPYLMPSVRPDDPSSPSTIASAATTVEKSEPASVKKAVEVISAGPTKEGQTNWTNTKVWSAATASAGNSNDCDRTSAANAEQEPTEKKSSGVRVPDEVSVPPSGLAASSTTPSSGTAGTGLSEYPPPPALQQPSAYPYPYAYMQGFPYGMDSAAYHMHLLSGGAEAQQHYKDQEKALLQQQQLQHQQQQQQQQQQLQHQQQQHEQRSRKEEIHLSDSQGLEKRASPATRDHHMSSSASSSVRKSSPAVHGSTSSSHSRDPAPVSLKEKQSENHQILKENIELKSQMDSNSSSKVKYSQHYDALVERQREEMRRYYLMQDHHHQQQQIHHHHHHHQQQQQHLLEQQQQQQVQQQQQQQQQQHHHHKVEPESLGFSHHHQSSQSHHGMSSHHQSSSSSSRSKESRDKALDSRQPTVPSSPHKPEPIAASVKPGHMGVSLSSSTSKSRDLAKDLSSSGSAFTGKKENKDDKEDRLHIKSEKSHHKSSHSEGQKPTMETTGPPPPPTNSYAYLHPSYHLQAPTHFAHMSFEHPHSMYRGAAGLNPILMSAPNPYGPASHPYLHPQLRYHVPPPPGPCDLGVPTPQHHTQTPQGTAEPLMGSGSAVGAGTPKGSQKALDLLHQVSQHYTNSTHKIHELQERALMSPSSTSTSGSGNQGSGTGSGVGGSVSGSGGATNSGDRPPSTATSTSSTPVSSERGNGSSSSTGVVGSGKGTSVQSSGTPSDSVSLTASTIGGKESGTTGDRSRSPPPQRHLHTHHHTHVGVGYPIYDTYAVNPPPWKPEPVQRRVPFRLTQ